MLHHAPPLPPPGRRLWRVVRDAELGHAERLVLDAGTAAARPARALDPLLIRSEALQRRFTEFGGLAGGEQCRLPAEQANALFCWRRRSRGAGCILKLFRAGPAAACASILLPPPHRPR